MDTMDGYEKLIALLLPLTAFIVLSLGMVISLFSRQSDAEGRPRQSIVRLLNAALICPAAMAAPPRARPHHLPPFSIEKRSTADDPPCVVASMHAPYVEPPRVQFPKCTSRR